MSKQGRCSSSSYFTSESTDVTRKNIARSLLVATILGAISGLTALRILDVMMAINLATMIALFLLPQWAQRLTLVIATMIATATLVTLVQLAVDDGVRFTHLIAVAAAVLTIVVAISGVFSRLTPPRGPGSPTKTDKWRALDLGIDPTLDE